MYVFLMTQKKKQIAISKTAKHVHSGTLTAGQNRLLELVATNVPLEDTLVELTRLIESQSEGMLCSILLLDENGINLRHGAAPSLPESYTKAIDGVSIGPRVGSCGTAVYRGETVIVTDILHDPLWADYRELASTHGLRACWSTPIFSNVNKPLGSFAMYYNEVRTPSPDDLKLIETASHIAGIAIEHARAVKALRASEERYRTLYQDNPSMYFTVNADGIVLSVNQFGINQLGYQISELVGHSVLKVFLQEDHSAVRKQLMECVNNQGKTFNWQIRKICKDGALIWVEEYARAIPSTDGSVQILIVCENITERKRGEDSLILFRTLVNQSNDAIEVLDIETGRFLDINEKGCLDLGYTREEFLNLSVFDIDPKVTPPIFRNIGEELKTSGFKMWEGIHLRKDGSTFPVEVSIKYVRLDREYMISVVRDITERKRAETVRQVLLEIMQGVVVTKDLQNLLSLIHNSISKVIVAENFIVVLYNKTTGLFEEVYTIDKYDPPAPPAKLEKSISSYVFRTGMPLLCTQSRFKELVAQGEVELVGSNSPSWMGVPLNTSEGTIGVMVVQDYDIPNRYSERDVDFLVSIAGQVALAVERKQAEDALRSSEERFSKAFYNSPNAVTISRLDNGKYIDVNEQFIKYVGLHRDEIIGKSSFELGLWVDPKLREDVVHTLQTNQSIRDIETNFIMKSGDSRTWCSSLEVIDIEGTPCILSIIDDITERKRTEEALKAGEERSRTMLKVMPDMMFRIDRNGFFLDYKAEKSDLYIQSLDSIIGKRARDITPPEFADLLEYNINATLSSGEMQIFEYCLPIPERGLRDYEARMLASGADEVTAIVRDITERKRTEGDLQKSEEKYRKLVEFTPDGLLIHVGGAIVFANNAAASILGADTPSDLVGKKLLNFVHPDYHSIVKERIQQIVVKKNNVPLIEEKLVRLDGIVIDAEVTAISFNYGAENAVQVVFRDITERKRTEEALKRNESFTRSIIENEPQCVKIVGPDGILHYMNPAGLAMIEVDNLEMVSGKSVYPIIMPGYRQAFKELVERVMQGEQGTLEFEIIGLKGTRRWLNTHTVPLFDEHGSVESLLGLTRDITERKRAELSLNESEERYRSLFDKMRDGVYRSTHEGKFVEVNPTMVKMFGYTSKEEMLQVDIKKDLYFEPSERDSLFLDSGQEKTEIFRMRRKDGSEIWVEDHGHYVHDEKGNVIYHEGILRDVTERKRAEDALYESETLLRETQAMAGLGSYVLDISVGYWRSSEILDSIFGIGKEYVRSVEGWADIVHPDDRQQMMEYFTNEVLGKGIPFDREYRIVRKNDSSVRWVHGIGKLEYDGNNQCVRMIGTIQDITDRKQAEKEITTLAQAMRSISECVSITDIDNRILFVNEAFLKTYGFEEHELLGKHISIILPSINSSEVVAEVLPSTLHGGWRGELINCRKDRSEFPITLSTSVIRDDKGQTLALIGVASDITERKIEEEKRKNLEVQLQQSQKLESLGTLASGIAHDFNNILGIIIGYASLFEHLPFDTEIIKKNADAITKAGLRGAGLVKQLLTFARKTDTQVESVWLNDIVLEVSKLLYETFPKTITISCNLDDRVPVIMADAGQVHQIVLNLCVNARDAMPDGGILTVRTSHKPGKEVRTKFQMAHAQEYVELSFADTGIGMDEATRLRIFEPFFTTKEIGKGTGLGLSLVFGIVESHNGFIDVQSEPGKGTTFLIYFPVPLDLVEFDEVKEPLLEEISGGSETILLVEDEELLRGLVKGILESKGYNVLTAKNGEEGVEQYQQHYKEIQVVLSDFGLPVLNGYEVFKRMKNINPDVIFIIASGFIEPEVHSEMLIAGVKDIIKKPFSLEQMLQSIKNTLDEK